MQTNSENVPFLIKTDDTQLSDLFPSQRLARSPLSRMSICLVLAGKASVEIDGQNHVLSRGSLLCIGPGHLLSMLSADNDFRFNWLSYEIDFLVDFPLLLKAGMGSITAKGTLLQLDERQGGMAEAYFSFINYRYKENPFHTEVLKGLLFSFLQETVLLQDSKPAPIEASRAKELTGEFFKLLHEHFKSERNVAFYAGKLYVSEKHLMRIVKDCTGQTIHRWCCDFVLREAKLLLKSTDMSVSAIAESLNFPSSSFFARFFRQHTGMSPLKYRKNG